MNAQACRAGGRWIAHGETRVVEEIEIAAPYKRTEAAIPVAPMRETARMNGATVAALAGMMGVSVREFAQRFAA